MSDTSFSESLRRARKARLKRMAPAAGPAPRHVLDPDYERAWAAEMLGVIDGGGRAPGKLRVWEIQRVTANHFGVTCSDLQMTRKTGDLVLPRHVAMYLAKQLTPKSLPAIGRCFGRDHSTVLHAVRKIDALLPHDAELAAHVACIREALSDAGAPVMSRAWMPRHAGGRLTSRRNDSLSETIKTLAATDNASVEDSV